MNPKPELPWIIRLSAPRRLAIVLAISLSAFFVLRLGCRSRNVSVCWNLARFPYLLRMAKTIASRRGALRRMIQGNSGFGSIDEGPVDAEAAPASSRVAVVRSRRELSRFLAARRRFSARAACP